MSNEEVEDIKEMFKKIDIDDDGIVTIEELKTGLQKFNAQLAESEVQLLIEAVSVTICIVVIFFLYKGGNLTHLLMTGLIRDISNWSNG